MTNYDKVPKLVIEEATEVPIVNEFKTTDLKYVTETAQALEEVLKALRAGETVGMINITVLLDEGDKVKVSCTTTHCPGLPRFGLIQVFHEACEQAKSIYVQGLSEHVMKDFANK